MICRYNNTLLDANLVPTNLLGAPELAPAGVYDTMRVDMVSALNPEGHYSRLAAAAHAVDLPFDISFLTWKEQIVELILANQEQFQKGKSSGAIPISYKVRTSVTQPAAGTDGADIAIVAWPLAHTDENRLPMSLYFSKTTRRPKGEKLFNHKRTGLAALNHFDAGPQMPLHLPDSIQIGRSETICFNTEGQLCESRYSNVFFVNGNSLFTPELSSPCLAGITREIAMQLASAEGFEVIEKPVEPDEANCAEAVFLTSSVRGIRSAGILENRRLPSSNRLVAKLQKSYHNLNKVSLL
jgi:branched-chain amino acid aminotransferase